VSGHVHEALTLALCVTHRAAHMLCAMQSLRCITCTAGCTVGTAVLPDALKLLTPHPADTVAAADTATAAAAAAAVMCPPPLCSLATKIGKKMQALQKAELAVAVKEDLKTVALGTSKINYMDPRITIAWCKRNEVREGGGQCGGGGQGRGDGGAGCSARVVFGGPCMWDGTPFLVQQ
jgi:hypothetical protein